jgi:hypothetical protein
MWWDNQNLDAPRRDSEGVKWYFRVWHRIEDDVHRAQVFYWDEAKSRTGVLILPDSARTDITALRAVIEKLASDPRLRDEHRRELRFPLERHYSEHGAGPSAAG